MPILQKAWKPPSERHNHLTQASTEVCKSAGQTEQTWGARGMRRSKIALLWSRATRQGDFCSLFTKCPKIKVEVVSPKELVFIQTWSAEQDGEFDLFRRLTGALVYISRGTVTLSFSTLGLFHLLGSVNFPTSFLEFTLPLCLTTWMKCSIRCLCCSSLHYCAWCL